jgi:hypothetical protein
MENAGSGDRVSTRPRWIIECMVGLKRVFGPHDVPVRELSDKVLERSLQMLAARFADLTGREIVDSHRRGRRYGLFPIHRDVGPERYHMICCCGDATAIAKREPWSAPRLD